MEPLNSSMSALRSNAPVPGLALSFVLGSILVLSCHGSRGKEELMSHEGDLIPALSREFSQERDSVETKLPRKVGVWTRSDKPRIITSRSIFDYMDGAGELYIGYRFRLLDVYDYSSADQDDILVEIYWMETSDDAFGLLSNDWGG